MLARKVLLCSFAAVAAAGRFHKRQDAEGSVPFNLFAYNEEVGGLPIVSNGTDVFIGDTRELNDTEAAVVIFTEGDDGIWYASPNTTLSVDGEPTWGNLSLSIPMPSSPPAAVQLESTSNATTGRTHTGFGFYGTVAFHTKEDGSFESLWFASPVADGLWALQWNETEGSEAMLPVTLKSTPPSSSVSS